MGAGIHICINELEQLVAWLLNGYDVDDTPGNDDDMLSDADNCHVTDPPVPFVEDLYELDWKEPEGHTAMKLEDFGDAARSANSDAPRRTFVVMHLFSGRHRKHDLEHWMRVMCAAVGLSLLMVSVNLE